MPSSVVMLDREINEIHMFDRDNYSSLSEAKASNAVYSCHVGDLDGNLYNSGSLYTAMQLVQAALECIGHKSADLAYVVTDVNGGVIDFT